MREHIPGATLPIPFGRAVRLWAWIGLISFGGPAGHIALLHRELVERRQWIPESRFLHALNFCMLLPGPEAQQLATYCGWMLHGTRGAIAAGGLFVLPSAVLLFGLAWLYAALGALPATEAFFRAFEPAVVAIVLVALARVGKRALRRPLHVAIAVLSLVALTLGAPFPAVVGGAALVGWGDALARRASFTSVAAGASTAPEVSMRPNPWHALRTGAVCGVLWWTPVLVCWWILGSDSVFVELGLFFSKAALVTFGGAYAVLPYIATASVETYAWTDPEAVMVGLALAETTPGPLIMVTQWIGTLAAWNDPLGNSPVASAALGAALVTWVTFLPCYLFILVGAPYVEHLTQNTRLAAALAAITAAVVGGMASLALWFAGRALFEPDETPRWLAIGAAVAFWYALARRGWSMHAVVGAAACLGLVQALLA